MSYYISGRSGFCSKPTPLSNYPLPKKTASFQMFLFLPRSSPTLRYQILSSFQFPKVESPNLWTLLLFVPTSQAFFSVIRLSFTLWSNSSHTPPAPLPSLSGSLPSLSGSLPLSSLSFHHRHVLWLLRVFNTFSARTHLLQNPPASLSYHPIFFPPSLLTLPPLKPFCCSLHLILSISSMYPSALYFFFFWLC